MICVATNATFDVDEETAVDLDTVGNSLLPKYQMDLNVLGNSSPLTYLATHQFLEHTGLSLLQWKDISSFPH